MTNIHPIVKDFIAASSGDSYKDLQSVQEPSFPSKESVERAYQLIANQTPEQKEKARNAAHQYLFGKAA